MVKFLLLLGLAAVATARTATSAHNKLEGRSSDETVLGDLKLAFDTYKDCSESDLGHCLKKKLAKTLTRLSRAEEFNLINGVTVVRDKDARVVEVEEAVPRGIDDGSLNNLILDNIVNFMRSHTIQIKFPTEETNEIEGEGRSRRKKLAPLLAIPLLIGGMMVPLAFGALALLAGKALIVSKLALVLAGIIGLKKLMSGGHSDNHEHEVVVSAAHAGPGWSRSIEKAQDLAYNAHTQ